MMKTMYKVIKIYAQPKKAEDLQKGYTVLQDDYQAEELMPPTPDKEAAMAELARYTNVYRNNGSGLIEMSEYWVEEGEYSDDGSFDNGCNYWDCPNAEWIGIADPDKDGKEVI